jgi:hypothetical protein
MNIEIIQQIRIFVADECCNFLRTGPNEIKNHCWGRPKTGFVCYYYLDKPKKCPYFEERVLPINPELGEDYSGNQGIDCRKGSIGGVKGVTGDPIRVSPSRFALGKSRGPSVLPGK